MWGFGHYEIVNYRAGLIIGTAVQISVLALLGGPLISRALTTNDKRMLTKYFAKVSVKFNPTHRSGMFIKGGTVQLGSGS